MVLLSDAGWAVPRIAAHLTCHPATVRGVLKRFDAAGPPSLRRSPPGPPPDSARRGQVAAGSEPAVLDPVCEESGWHPLPIIATDRCV